MRNDIQICARGWLGNEPTMHVGPNGGRLARFRLGVTPRIFDRATGAFRDGPTQWFSVKAWRDLADNACDCLHKGTPVVVRGVLTKETWGTEGAERSDDVITADSIGVDLGTGTAKFTRTVRASRQAEGAEAPAGTVTTGDGRWEVDAELPEDSDDYGSTDYTMVEEGVDEDLVGSTG